MGNYISASDIDNWPSGSNDAYKTRVIEEAEQLIEKILHRHFYSKTFDIQLNGTGKSRLFLPLTAPVLSVRKVYVSGIELPTSWIKNDDQSIMVDLDATMDELEDGVFADWEDTTTPTFWLTSVAGTSAISKETDSSYIQSGDYSLKMAIDALDSAAEIYQDFNMKPGGKYNLNIYRMMSAAGVTLEVMVRDKDSNVYLSSTGAWTTTATWIEVSNALTMTAFELEFYAYALYGDYRIRIRRKTGASQSIWIDDVSIEPEDGGGVGDPEYFYRMKDTAAGLFPSGYNNIRIIGRYGNAVVPRQITKLAKIIIRHDNDGDLYTNMIAGGEKIGDYSYNISTVPSTSNVFLGIREADEIIRFYRRQQKPRFMAP